VLLGHAPGRDRRGSLRRFGRRQRRHRTPQSVNAFYTAELVFGPGRGALRDVSHLEAATMSWVTWWRRPGFTAISETGVRRSSSGPTLHKTTPPARKESKVRSLQGSQGEPGRSAIRMHGYLRPWWQAPRSCVRARSSRGSPNDKGWSALLDLGCPQSRSAKPRRLSDLLREDPCPRW